ncbi:MAG: hypothetical protein OHK0046_25210 [Anaerolineae bacterium]
MKWGIVCMRNARVTLLLLLLPLLAACGRQLSDNPPTAAPRATATVAAPAEDATAASETQPTETTQQEEAAPVETVESAASAPTDPLVLAISQADAANGQTLFNQMNSTGFACSSCHNAASEDRLIGPGLLNVPAKAATRVEGQSAYEYLHNAILHPNDFIVPGDPAYPAGLMPQVYGDLYSEQEVYDLVAYLLTLGELPAETTVAAAPTEAPAEDAAPAEEVVTEEVVETAEATVEEAPAETAEATEAQAVEPTAVPATEIPATVPAVPVNPTAEIVLTLEGQGVAAFGEFMFTQPLNGDQSCADCHTVDSAEDAGLLGIGARAAQIDSVPERYLYGAIISDDLHGDLPENYGEILTAAQINDIIAYLMSLGN